MFKNHGEMAHKLVREYGSFVILLLLYVSLVIFLSRTSFGGDEVRYIRFANNLANGFYSPIEPSEIDLWNGPGYPFILMPFALLGLPWITAKVANAFFLLGAIVLLYRTLCLYIKPRQAKRFALLLGLYPPFMAHLPYLYTEPFTILLLTAFSLFFCHHASTKKSVTPSFFAAVFFLSWLALTKIIFGYVISCVFMVSGIHYILRRRLAPRNCAAISFVALLLCCPYLIYTHSLTGKIFYWGNSGGMSLYWMSSPYPHEFGDWHTIASVKRNPELNKNHGSWLDSIEGLSPVQRDDAFKKQAVRNIITHPGKYMLNVAANIGRMLFSYPYSYAYDRLTTYFWLIPNMFMCVIGILCLYPTWRARRSVPAEIFTLLLYGLVTFVGCALLSAYARQFYVLVPIWGIWIGFVLFNVLSITIRKDWGSVSTIDLLS